MYRYHTRTLLILCMWGEDVVKKYFRVMFVILAILSFAACSPTQVPTDSPSKVPTDEEVKLAYQQATEAYSWFDLTTMNFDANSEIEYNGNIYMKVNQEGIQSLSDLEAYLRNLFSEDIVDSLLETNCYIDIDGVLYAMPADRGTNIFAGEEHHKIIRESDKKIIYEVTVDILDDNLEKAVDEEVYSFSYEFIEDKWVFTNFSLVR